MANLILKQIERGTASFGTTDVTVTVTLGTTLTNVNKTVLLFGVNSTSSSPFNYHITGRVISTTQIQFTRHNNPPSQLATVEYQVVEFSAGIFVQHIEITPTGATTGVSIIGIDPLKSFVMGSIRNSGAGYGSDDCVLYDITSGTNLNIVTQSFTSLCISAFQVIQIDEANVQKVGVTAWTTDGQQDLAVSTITESKTLFVFGYTDNNTNDTNQWVYMTYVNSTTVRLLKDLTGTFGSKNVIAYVVSVPNNLTVQNITTTIASGASTVSPSITTVTVADTALLNNSQYQCHASSSALGDEAGTACFNLSGLTTTAFTATRASTPAVSAVTNVQVLSFLKTGNAGNWFLLPDKNELSLCQSINGMR